MAGAITVVTGIAAIAGGTAQTGGTAIGIAENGAGIAATAATATAENADRKVVATLRFAVGVRGMAAEAVATA
jgi:hypothetical protein